MREFLVRTLAGHPNFVVIAESHSDAELFVAKQPYPRNLREVDRDEPLPRDTVGLERIRATFKQSAGAGRQVTVRENQSTRGRSNSMSEDLKEAFERLGLSPRGAATAAADDPRDAVRTAARRREADGFKPGDPITPIFSKGEDGLPPTYSKQGWKASDFAVVGDAKDDTTWFWPLTSPGEVGLAVRSLVNGDGGPVGDATTMTAKDFAALKDRLKKAWLEVNPGPLGIPLPPGLSGVKDYKQPEAARRADLRGTARAFERLGLSPRSAEVAAAGREATTDQAVRHLRGGQR